MKAEFDKVKEEMRAEFDKAKEEMQAELDKAKEEVKDAWNSAAASGELLEKEFEERLREAGDHGGDHGIDIDALRTQIDFLKYDLKAAKGAAEHYQNELDKLQRAAAKFCRRFLPHPRPRKTGF
jgi:chromosome segregation ATPase